MRSFGYEASPTPDLLLEVSASERPRGVGAFTPDGCGASTWAVPPHRKWLIGGGKVLTLNVRLLDARTNAPVYRSSASLRAGGGSAAAYADELAEAALPADPRAAPKAAPARC